MIPSASFTSGIKSFMSDALYKRESFFETIEISNILFLFANCIMFFSSDVSPELLIILIYLFSIYYPGHHEMNLSQKDKMMEFRLKKKLQQF